MAPHPTAPLPEPGDDWREWFLENSRSFRRTLLMRRDGARLPAGLVPGPADPGRPGRKMAFLAAAGLSERDAQFAMLAASRYTAGTVLEEQADPRPHPSADGVPDIDPEAAFEAGLALIADGLAQRRRPGLSGACGTRQPSGLSRSSLPSAANSSRSVIRNVSRSGPADGRHDGSRRIEAALRPMASRSPAAISRPPTSPSEPPFSSASRST